MPLGPILKIRLAPCDREPGGTLRVRVVENRYHWRNEPESLPMSEISPHVERIRRIIDVIIAAAKTREMVSISTAVSTSHQGG